MGRPKAIHQEVRSLDGKSATRGLQGMNANRPGHRPLTPLKAAVLGPCSEGRGCPPHGGSLVGPEVAEARQARGFQVHATRPEGFEVTVTGPDPWTRHLDLGGGFEMIHNLGHLGSRAA